ncbi:MAG: ribose-phosphate pyrophosphokinase [Myxococcales bacterium]|nr:ribose-phosphate pyrophosphokinase [Myxococcales bacterium]
MNARIKIFAGRSHPALSQAICDHLDLPVGKSEVVKFSNDNLMVKIEENVRECDVFYIQTASSPTNEHIVETLIAIDALKSASAARITAVLPYFPYARSDKKDRPRISIAARLMADLLQTAGADRVLCMDLHSPQIQGFFHVPVDQLEASPLIAEYIRSYDLSNTVLVAGDAGHAKELARLNARLGLSMAVVDKRRYADDDQAVATNLIGSVAGMNAIIVDDEIATGGTVVEAARFLLEKGALSVSVAATHGVLSGPAIERINDSPFREVVVTDTMPVADKQAQCSKLKVLSVASLFAKAIRRIHDGDSVSDLF